MRLVPMIGMALAGVALGVAQYKLLQRMMTKHKIWLFAIKLPMWALPMLAAAYYSITALLCLTAGAAAAYIGIAFLIWHGQRKGDG